MRRTYIIIILIVINNVTLAQVVDIIHIPISKPNYALNCMGDFIENFEHTYKNSKSKFDKIISKSLKNSKLKSEIIINYTSIVIPIIVGKRMNGVKVSKENFLCHLNVKGMEFHEAAILKDSSVSGVVTLCPGDNCKYEFVDESPYIDLFIEPLVKKLIEIRPSIVFSIYHVSNAFWYIKDGELKVLVFGTNISKSTDLVIYKAEDYIQSLSEDQIDSFINFKKVKEVSY